MKWSPIVPLLLLIAGCGGAGGHVTSQAPAVSSASGTCDEIRSPKENERSLFFRVSQRDLTTKCIPEGGWESFTSGPAYDPQLKNCSSAVFQAAKAHIEPTKVIREQLRKNSVIIHFTGPHPLYYEVSYEWLERSRAAVLSVANYTTAGAAMNDESLSELIEAVEAASRCQ